MRFSLCPSRAARWEAMASPTFATSNLGELVPKTETENTFLKKSTALLAFLFESSSMMFTVTDYAMNRSGKLHGLDRKSVV